MSGSAKAAVSQRRVTTYDIYAKDDGRDYWRIAHAYLQSGIRREELAKNWPEKPEFTLGAGEGAMRFTGLSCVNPKRVVFRVETLDGVYLLKWMRIRSSGLKRLFPGSIGLTRYTRLFRKVRDAIENGCRSTQDYLLVAERWVGWFRMEVVTVLEYVEGESMGERDDYGPFAEDLTRAAEDLLRHDLTLDDMSPYNFLLTPDGVKVIDLSCRPPTRPNAVKMVMKMNRRFGLAIPVHGLVNRLIGALLAARYVVRGWLGKKPC